MAATVEQLREIIGGDAASLAELERLTDENDGGLTPELVLDAARAEGSPLHRHFEWEDAEAAESWRRHQARALIRSYALHIVDAGGERTIRYYTNVVVADENSYRRTEEVLRVDTLRLQRRNKILRELGRIRGELATYIEFEAAMAAVDVVVESLKAAK